MRIGPAGARRSYTNNGVPCWTHKISIDIRQKLPPFFYRGAKCPNFWPKFQPRSSSNRRILEMQRFTGKQKQSCQGPMIALPSYQRWDGWVPPTPRNVGAMVTPKGKSGKFLIYPPFQWPTPSIALPMLYQLMGPWLLQKGYHARSPNSPPTVHRRVTQKGKSGKFLIYPPL